MTRSFLTLPLSFLLITACSSTGEKTEIVPLKNAVANEEGTTAAVYPIPAEGPSKGQVDIQALGRTQLKRRDKADANLPAMHLRFEVKNNSDQPWSFDSRQQQIIAAEDSRSGSNRQLRATFVHAAGKSSKEESQLFPIVKIPGGEKQVIDLYYALPDDLKGEQQLQSFQLSWQLTTGQNVFLRTTPFRVTNLVDSAADVYPEPARTEGPERQSGNRSPASTGALRPPPTNWWMDPFSDLPSTWRDFVY